MPRCVADALRGTGAVSSPLFQPPESYADAVVTAITCLDSSLFDGLDAMEIRRCITRSNVITCAEGDRLIKDGGTARNLYVLLDGALEVRSGGRSIAVVLPGEIVGERACLLGCLRSCDVDVLSDGTKVLNLGEGSLRRLIVDEPALAAKVLHNLSRGLCRRQPSAT